MRSRHILLAVTVLCVGLATMPASAGQLLGSSNDPPLPSPAFLEGVPAGKCTVTNEYEAAQYGLKIGDLIYDQGCKRITFAFGPLLIKPGQNDALIGPVTIEKPAYNGYMTRFKPDLLRFDDGTPPPTEELHVHHATWLNAGASYGSGPFAASGEEKTYRNYPKGYGMRIGGNDRWLLLYMLHTDVTEPKVVWLTYEMDFIDEATATNVHKIAGARPIWRDVQSSTMPMDGMPDRTGNPIFNIQKGFGAISPESGRRTCVWPKMNCARNDYYGEVSPHQGLPGPNDPLENYPIKGTDWTVPPDLSGTLVYGGGHVHPGGLNVTISLVRNGVEKDIIVSDALYWDWDDPSKVGGDPVSWNFSMAPNSASLGWKVKIKPGDIIRINGEYDSQQGSWYGQMGILNLHVVKDDPHWPPGVDVFDDNVVIDRGVSTRARLPEGPYDSLTGWRPSRCEPDLVGADGEKRLCLRGQPTHGQLPESGNFNGGCPPGGCPALTTKRGPVVDQIVSAGFTYGNADLSVIDQNGIPRIRRGQPTRFWSFDTVARVFHSFTRCEYPCNGGSDMAYPYPGGGSGDKWDTMDFDSGELGYGTFIEQTKFQVGGGSQRPLAERATSGLYWDFTPTQTGVYTFWCRIHRSMRGAVEVVE